MERFGCPSIALQHAILHPQAMVDFIADYYQNVESKPVKSQVKPGYLQVPSIDSWTVKGLIVCRS